MRVCARKLCLHAYSVAILTEYVTVTISSPWHTKVITPHNTHRLGHTHPWSHTHLVTYTHTLLVTYTHTHTHTHTHIHLVTWSHTHLITYTHIHTWSHTHTHIHLVTWSYTHLITYTHTWSHTHIHSWSHTHIHLVTWSYTHLITHTHTHLVTYTHIHTWSHTHTYTLGHIHTHTYLVTYTHIHTWSHTHTHLVTDLAHYSLNLKCKDWFRNVTGAHLIFQTDKLIRMRWLFINHRLWFTSFSKTSPHKPLIVLRKATMDILPKAISQRSGGEGGGRCFKHRSKLSHTHSQGAYLLGSPFQEITWNKNSEVGDVKMAQWVRALTALPKDPSSNPSNYMVAHNHL
jgi:hypothetical protein